ncbi:Protein kinase of the Mitotic Exit Network [Dimargaris verticillata]|uniref:Protein kinase of the Mitotic Exit Network n=1 Tax=Dimargaris verticillata TaxID=2761393 RepID=A0A9W8BC10_9FUNG|nr:Protein kinase of the Mitotic Exit Network [Dimargaris verticillata]
MTAVQQYQLGDCIGKGAFGTVYRGLNLENGQVVAVKQIPLHSVSRPSARPVAAGAHADATLHRAPDSSSQSLSSCLAEITLLKKLQHNNIVQYLGFVQTDEHLYQILEYCENGSLRSIYKRFGKFPENLIAVYLRQVLLGLNYLHNQGIIHRDIKGANVLTTKTGQVKLADFGISTLMGEETSVLTAVSTLSLTNRAGSASGKSERHQSVGSPYWMAPEVIELNGATTASDIWSLGCTIIELLQAEPPHSQLSTMAALFRMVQDDHPPWPATISPRVAHFLRQCFHKQPHQRATAKALLQHPWIVQASRASPVPQPADLVDEGQGTFSQDIQTVMAWNDQLQQVLKSHTTPPRPSKASLTSPSQGTATDSLYAKSTRRDIARYRSPDAKEERWDQDFDNLTNLTPSNLRPADRLFKLTLSPSPTASEGPPSCVTSPTHRPLYGARQVGNISAAASPTRHDCRHPLSPPPRQIGPSALLPSVSRSNHSLLQDNWDNDYDISQHDLLARLDSNDALSAASRHTPLLLSRSSFDSHREDQSPSSTLLPFHTLSRTGSSAMSKRTLTALSPLLASSSPSDPFASHDRTLASPALPAQALKPPTGRAHRRDSASPAIPPKPFPSLAAVFEPNDTPLAVKPAEWPLGDCVGPPLSRPNQLARHKDHDQDVGLEIPDDTVLSNERLHHLTQERARARARAQSMGALTRPARLPSKRVPSSTAVVPSALSQAPIVNPQRSFDRPPLPASPALNTSSSTVSWDSAVDLSPTVSLAVDPAKRLLTELDQLVATLCHEETTADTVVATCHTLSDWLTHHSAASPYFTERLAWLTVFQRVHVRTPTAVLLAVVTLVNQLLTLQPTLGSTVCHSGGLVALMRVLDGNGYCQYPRELCLELGFFIKQICLNEAQECLSAFCVAQGPRYLLKLLRLDANASPKQSELVWMTVDVLLRLVEAVRQGHITPSAEVIVHALVLHGGLDPLTQAFYRFAADQREPNYLHKMAIILDYIAGASIFARDQCGQLAIVKRVVKTVRVLPTPTLLLVLRFLNHLASSPANLTTLIEVKLLESLVALFKHDTGRSTTVLLEAICALLFRLCHLSAERQQRAIRAGALVYWIRLAQTSPTFRPYTVPLLTEVCQDLVPLHYNADATTIADWVTYCIQRLDKYGAWALSVTLLEDRPWCTHALDMMTALYQLMPHAIQHDIGQCRVEIRLIALLSSFTPTDPTVDPMVGSLLKATRMCPPLATHLAMHLETLYPLEAGGRTSSFEHLPTSLSRPNLVTSLGSMLGVSGTSEDTLGSDVLESNPRTISLLVLLLALMQGAKPTIQVTVLKVLWLLLQYQHSTSPSPQSAHESCYHEIGALASTSPSVLVQGIAQQVLGWIRENH